MLPKYFNKISFYFCCWKNERWAHTDEFGRTLFERDEIQATVGVWHGKCPTLAANARQSLIQFDYQITALGQFFALHQTTINQIIQTNQPINWFLFLGTWLLLAIKSRFHMTLFYILTRLLQLPINIFNYRFVLFFLLLLRVIFSIQ